MSKTAKTASFEAVLQRPAKLEGRKPWGFVVLPKSASDVLPRRGRTTVQGTINGEPFMQTLEPDGNLSHWILVSNALLGKLDANFGDNVRVELMPIKEPEPKLPADFKESLESNPDALATWALTTTLARVDWIHWIVSGKLAATRTKRINDAMDMLSAGKKRVCCFDPSGHYDKSKSAPQAAD